jgi:hypothetical protein
MAGSPLPAAARTECAPYQPRLTHYPVYSLSGNRIQRCLALKLPLSAEPEKSVPEHEAAGSMTISGSRFGIIGLPRFVAIRGKKENLAGSITCSPAILAVASAAGPGRGRLWIGGKCWEWRCARRWAGRQKVFDLLDASCLMAPCFKRPPRARNTFSASSCS